MIASYLRASLVLAALSSGPAAAEVECQRTAEQVGLDQGYPVRAELATVPHGRVTGREMVRYFVRFDSRCLLSRDVQRVDAMAVRLYNELMAGSGSCRPPANGRPARILFGTVPSADSFDTRELQTRSVSLPKPAVWTPPIPLSKRLITGRFSRLGNVYFDADNPRHRRNRDPFKDRTTKLRGGWATLPLGEPVEIVAGRDLVLGLEITQEPWECPLLVSGPFEAPGPRQGSYLQLVQYEIQNADGSTAWRLLDCDGDGIGDAIQGRAFAVDDVRARSVCDLRFPHASFHWNLRAVVQLSQPLTPPEEPR